MVLGTWDVGRGRGGGKLREGEVGVRWLRRRGGVWIGVGEWEDEKEVYGRGNCWCEAARFSFCESKRDLWLFMCRPPLNLRRSR